MAVKIIVTGVLGRMGTEIARIAIDDDACELVGCTELPESNAVGKPVGDFIGDKNITVPISDSVASIPGDDSVVVEFTSPAGTMGVADALRGTQKGLVVGTTGLNDQQLAVLSRLAETNPVLVSPNMSLGVNLLFYLTSLVSKRLGEDFDIEIIEAHHRFKKDAPSGTAKRLGELAAEAIGKTYQEAVRDGRSGMVGERTPKEIGMHAVRGGDIVGDHTVLFAGMGERIELRHVAHSRTTFAKGAVTAAKWLSSKPAGLYSMNDMLGL
ncbi:MAG: 4-hydroxy-tetrahydrodipicolinate reductase [Fibrobacterota bacterium]